MSSTTKKILPVTAALQPPAALSAPAGNQSRGAACDPSDPDTWSPLGLLGGRKTPMADPLMPAARALCRFKWQTLLMPQMSGSDSQKATVIFEGIRFLLLCKHAGKFVGCYYF